MKIRAITLMGLLAAFAPGAAIAQGHLTLGWSNCRESGGGTSTRDFACNTNSGSIDLVAALVPGPGLTSLQSAEFRLDIDVQAPSVVPWWQITAPTSGCRTRTNIVVDDSNDFGVSCANVYWRGIPGLISGSLYEWPVGSSNRAHLRVIIAIPTDTGHAGTPEGIETHMFTARISNNQTAPPGVVCSGCETPACVSFSFADLYNAPGPSFVYGGGCAAGDCMGSAASPSCVLWQSGVVSTPNRTWGSIKSIYR